MLLPWRWVALLALLPLVLAKSCPAGQAASALSPCTACRKGFFKPAAGDAPCQACPAGTYQDGRNATRCTDCPPGQFTATEGRALCDFCPRSSFAASPGSTSCELCPERSTSTTLGSVTIADCRCEEGSYTREPEDKHVCLACPEGTVCSGGANPPVPLAGYWASAFEPDQVHNCRPADACLGGLNNPCAEHYLEGSRLCYECGEGSFRQYDGDACTPCPFNGWHVVAAILIPLLEVAACILFLLYALYPQVGAPYTLITGIQLAALFGEVNVDWPAHLPIFFTWYSMLNANLELMGMECGFHFTTIWSLTMTIPFQVMAMLGAMFHGRKHLHRILPSQHRGRPSDHFIHAYVIFLLMAYVFLARGSFEILDCTRGAADLLWLDAAPFIPCPSTSWYFMIGPSIVGVLVFVLAVPIIVITYVVGAFKPGKHRGRGGDRNQARYGFLFIRFKDSFLYWEVILLLWKVTLLLSVKFSSLRPALALALAASVNGVMLIAQAACRPYTSYYGNMLATAIHLTLTYLSLSIAVFHYDSFSESAGFAVAFVGFILMLVCFISGIAVTIYEVHRVRLLAVRGPQGKAKPAHHEEMTLIAPAPAEGATAGGDATDPSTDVAPPLKPLGELKVKSDKDASGNDAIKLA